MKFFLDCKVVYNFYENFLISLKKRLRLLYKFLLERNNLDFLLRFLFGNAILLIRSFLYKENLYKEKRVEKRVSGSVI